MKISYKLRIPRSCLKLAEVVLTVISLCGSIAQYGTAQESSPPTPASIALPAKPPVAPLDKPTKTFDNASDKASPALPFAPDQQEPNQQEQGSTRPLPFENPPPKAEIKLPTYPDSVQADSSRSDARRLQLLEKQIMELTSELRALRAEKRGDSSVRTTPPQAPSSSRLSSTSKPPRAVPIPAQVYTPQRKLADQVSALQRRSEIRKDDDVIPLDPQAAAVHQNPLPANPDVQSVTITRSTYKLPAGRAEALAKLLTELLDDEIDIKVKGEALQVTAPAQDQQTIERVIALFLRRGRDPKPAPALDSATY